MHLPLTPDGLPAPVVAETIRRVRLSIPQGSPHGERRSVRLRPWQLLLIAVLAVVAVRSHLLPTGLPEEPRPVLGGSSEAAPETGVEPLLPLHTLLGRITDQGGAPIEGATVAVLRQRAGRISRSAGAAVTSGDDGHFAFYFDQIAEEQTRLVVRIDHPFHATTWKVAVWEAGEDLVILDPVSAPPSRVLIGKVESEGPITDGTVLLQREDRDPLLVVDSFPLTRAPEDTFSAVLGSDGSYNLRVPSGCRYILQASAAGSAVAARVLDVPANADGPQIIESLSLEHGAEIMISVDDEPRDETGVGSPVGFATIVVDPEGESDSGQDPIAELGIRRIARCASDGLAAIRHLDPNRRYTVRVQAPGYRSGRARFTALSDEIGLLNVRLSPTVPMRGRVVEEGSGRPIPSYTIRAVRSSLDEILEPHLARRIRAKMNLALGQQPADAGMPAAVDFGGGEHHEGGSFTVDAPPDGSVYLAISATGYVPRLIGPVLRDQPEHLIELEPRKPTTGRVIDAATGTGVPGATIEVSYDITGVRQAISAFAADEDLIDDPRIDQLTTTIQSIPSTLARVETGRDGTFSVNLASGRPLLLQVSVPGGKFERAMQRRTIGRAEDAPIVLELQALATTNGVVRGVGHRHPDTVVYVRSPTAPTARASIDPTGKFSLPGLQPGRYWVDIGTAGSDPSPWQDLFYKALRDDRLLPTLEIPAGNEDAPIQLDAAKSPVGGSLILVLGQALRAVTGKHITVRRPGAASSDTQQIDNGIAQIRVPYLAPGQWVVECYSRDGLIASSEATFDGVQPTTVRLDVQ